MRIDLYLGRTADVKLTYEFYDNPVAKVIYERMKTQPNEVIDREIFKGFGETVEQLREKLQCIVDKLKTRIPLEYDDILDTNKLHTEFPKYNDLYYSDDEVRPLLQKFNTLIHHIEQMDRFSHPAFQFACYDEGIDFEDSWYNEFCPYKRKGEMYMHYPHVGKHYLEIFMDKDYNVPEDQIVLTHKVANTFSFWCGETLVREGDRAKNLFSDLAEFHEKIAAKIPYDWGDPRLAIGYVPIGMFVGDIDTQLHAISQNKFVHGWEVQ